MLIICLDSALHNGSYARQAVVSDLGQLVDHIFYRILDTIFFQSSSVHSAEMLLRNQDMNAVLQFFYIRPWIEVFREWRGLW